MIIPWMMWLFYAGRHRRRHRFRLDRRELDENAEDDLDDPGPVPLVLVLAVALVGLAALGLLVELLALVV